MSGREAIDSAESGRAHEERLRQLERDHSATLARLDGVEGQQRAIWSELRRISREGRDELHNLRIEGKADTEKLLAAITANKLAWSMLSGGHKAAAWIVGTLIGVFGLMVAASVAAKRLFWPE